MDLNRKTFRGGLFLFFSLFLFIFTSSIFSNCARKKERKQLVVVKDEFEKVEVGEFVLDEKTGQEFAKNQILIYIVANSKSELEEKKTKVSEFLKAKKGEFSVLGEIEFLSEKGKVGVLLQGKVPARTPEEIKQIVLELRNFDGSIRAFPNMRMKPNAVLDGRIPLDPLFDSWNETPGGNNWHFEAVNMPGLWKIETQGKVPVAVIEFGIKKHEDLEYDLRRGGVEGEGADWAQNHGVSVLGVLGAVGNNSKGIAGTIWRGDIKVYVIDGTLSSLIQSIVFALEDEAKVILFAGGLEWGSVNPEGNPEAEEILEYHREIFSVVFQYVRYYDGLFVQSAGNEGKDARYAGVGVSVKDLFPHNILLVGSTNILGKISSFSNRGSLVDIYLPGESIFTTCWGSSGDYCLRSGTSYSAAMGAGVAVLLGSINGDLRSGEIKEMIMRGMRVEGEGENARYVIDFSISGYLAIFSQSGNLDLGLRIPELGDIVLMPWFQIEREAVVEIGNLGPKAVECAVYDNTTADGDPAYKAPKCPENVEGCSSCGLLDGNGDVSGYPEPNQPNTLYGLVQDLPGTGANAPIRIISIQVETMSESGFIQSGPSATDRRNIKVTVRAWGNNPDQWIDVFYTQDADASSPVFVVLGSYRWDCGGSSGWGSPVVSGTVMCSRIGNETTISFLMSLPSVSPRSKMAIRARIRNSPLMVGWLDGWAYRRAIVVRNIRNSTTLTDYQVLIANPIYDETGLVGSWHFNEGSGAIAYDSSGNNNNGTLYNGPSWVNGKFGKALSFDGVDDYIKSSTANRIGNKAISECLWIKFNSFSTENQFGYIRSSGTVSQRYFYFSSWCSTGAPHNCVHLGTLRTDGTWGRGIATGRVFETNIWYHICGVIDTVNGFIKVYINGNLFYSDTIPTGDIPGTPYEIWIGGTPEGYQRANGIIDEVRIYNRALSDAEIQALYQAKARLDYGDIRFTDSDGTTLLNYWQEADGRFWVKVPSIPANSTKTIYVYYGNPGATSLSDGDAVFDFFDDFEGASLDTSKWGAYANSYSVSNSVLRVNIGGIERTSPFSFNIQDGYIAETKVIHYGLASNYGGVLPEVASSPFTASGNGNADATILYMRENGSATVYYWIGDGSSASYNVAYASTGWTSSDNVWYITGISVRGGEVKLWRDGTAIVTVTGITWRKNLKYIKLGSFHRDAAYNIQDTGYDWVRVRKYTSPEPTARVGVEEETGEYTFAANYWRYRKAIVIDNTLNSTTLTDYQVLIANPIYDETGLVGSWHFNEGSGAIAYDSSGNNNNGTLYNGPSWVNGKFGKALSFDGVDDYIKSSTANRIGNKAISECLWIKFNSFSTENQFGYIRSSGTVSQRYFYFSSWCSTGAPHNCVHLGTLRTDGTWGRGIATGRVFETNIWYHICGVIDTVNGFIKVYINGNLFYSATIPTGDIPGTPYEIWIGGTPEGYQRANGIIDEVRIYNRALSDAEILDLYQAKARLDYGDIRFTDSDGTTLLSYWQEADGRFWVKVPSIPANSTKTIYVYYGNPGATSLSDGDAVFDFFDDFEGASLDTSKWGAYANSYSVSNSVLRVNIGGIERTSPFPFNIQDGYIAETKVIHYALAANYGGVLPEVASSPFTASGNGNADATILYMREVGRATVYYWIGDGSSASYNVAYASTGWTSSDNVWYITGISVRGGEVKLWRDGTAIVTVTGITWRKNLKYIKLGSFHRDAAYNIQDTGYDWIRVRKYTSPEPTASVGSEETGEYTFANYWRYRRAIVINNSGNSNTLTDYQVLVRMDTASLISGGKMRGDCGDIRFTDSDGQTLLSYWIEGGCNTTDTRIWVKVPTIPASSTKTIYVYYGNPDAGSLSNGDATFDFFDDFLGTSLDTSKWVAYANSYSVSNSVLRVNIGGIERTSPFPFNIQDGYIAETKVIHYGLASNYGGVLPEVASSPFTAGGNANADATILYMREVGRATVYYWIGDGSSASYNVAYASTGWTSSDNVWYITGISVRGGEVKLWRDGTAIVTVTGITWRKNLKYIKLGSFHRDAAYNIQDTGYDWVRVRKYTSPEPTASVGAEEETTIEDNDDLVFTVQNPPSSFTCGIYDSNFRAPVCYGDGWCGTCNTVPCRDTTSDSAESPAGFYNCGGNEPNQPNTLFSQCQDTSENTDNQLDEQIRRINIKSLAPSGKFEGGELVEASLLVACRSDDQIVIAYASGVTYLPTQLANWRYLTTISCPSGAPVTYWYNLHYTLRLDNVEGWHAVRAVLGRCPGCATQTSICPSMTYRDADDFVFYVKAKPPSSLPVCAVYDSYYKTPRCPQGASACSTCELIKSRDSISGTAEQNQPNTLSSTCSDDGPTSAQYLQTESIERIEIKDLSGSGTFQPGGQVEVSVLVYCDPVYPNYLTDYLVLLYSSNADSPTFTRVLTATCTSAGYNLFRTNITLANVAGKHVVRAIFKQGAFSSGEICAGGVVLDDGDTDDLVFDVGVVQAPPNFKLEGIAPDSITLNWTDVAGETRYEIRWTDTYTPDYSKWQVISDNYSANTTWYLDSGLTGGEERCYAIRACSGSVCSDFVWDCTMVPTESARCAVYDPVWRVPRCEGGINKCSTCNLVLSRDSLPRRQEINTPNAWYSSSCTDGGGGDYYSSRSVERIVLSTGASAFSSGSPISVTVRVFCSSTADYVHLYVSAGTSPISWSLVGSQACSGSNQVEDKTFSFTPSVADWYVIRAVVTGSGASTCPGGSQDEVDDVVVSVVEGSRPPYSLSVTAYSTETITQYVVSFIDDSGNEDGFAIEGTQDGVSWTRYEWWSDSTTKPGTGSRTIKFSLSSETRWCFRVASFKQVGSSLVLSQWADNATRCVIGVKAPSNLYVESMPVLRTLRFFWQDNSSYESGQNFEWRHSASSSYNRDSVGQNTAYYEKQFPSESIYCFRVTNWWSGDPSKPEEQGSYSQGYSGEVCKHAIGSPYPLYAAFSSSGIRLDWQDNATSDVTYLIQVTDGSSWTTFQEVSSNTVNYEFNPGASGRYCYRVRVKSGAVELWASNVVCVNYGNAACSGVMNLNVGLGSALKSVLSDGDMVFVAFADKVSGVSKPVVSWGSTTVKWSKTLGSQVSSNICSLSQDRIFIGAGDKIYVIRKRDGAILSERAFGSGNNGCAVSGGKIYLTTSTGYVWKLSPDLKVEGVANAGSAVTTPVIDEREGGYIYVPRTDGVLKVYDLNLVEVGSVNLGGPITYVVLGPKRGEVFAAGEGGNYLYRVTRAGTSFFAKSVDVGGAIRTSPVVYQYGAEVTVIVGLDTGVLKAYGVDSSGNFVQLWSQSLGGAPRGAAVLAGDLVFIGVGNQIQARKVSDGTAAGGSCPYTGLGNISTALDVEGSDIVFGDETGRLYIIAGGVGESKGWWVSYNMKGKRAIGGINTHRGLAYEEARYCPYSPTSSGYIFSVIAEEIRSDYDGKEIFAFDNKAWTGYLISATGQIIWSAYLGWRSWSLPAVGDIIAGGSKEIAMGMEDARVVVLRSDGGWYQILLCGEIRAVTLADVDGNGDDEIIATSQGCNKTYVIDWDGTSLKLLREYALSSDSGNNSYGVWYGGKIYVAGFSGNLYMFDYASYSTSVVSVAGSSVRLHTPAMGDVDGDGAKEVIVGGDNGVIYIRNLDGTSKGSVDIRSYTGGVGKCMNRISLGDADRDGRDEIYVVASDCTATTGNSYLVSITYFSGGYQVRWGSGPLRGTSSSHVVIGDFDGDGMGDIATVVHYDDLYIWRWDGSMNFVGRAYYSGGGARGGMSVIDLDEDGRQNIIFGDRSSGCVHVFEFGEGTASGQVWWGYNRANPKQNGVR